MTSWSSYLMFHKILATIFFCNFLQLLQTIYSMKLMRLFLLLLLHSLPVIFSQSEENATITVQGFATVAETDDTFVCATIDWWPPEKCNNKQCPWGNSSVLNLDLFHPKLSMAIKAFNTLRIRVGGTLQDRVVYDMGSSTEQCHPFSVMPSQLFGFSEGCLSMKRWDQLNHLFQETGAVAIFGLNALQGKQQGSDGAWQGAWNSSNAQDFIKYTVSKRYPIDTWEFGNELSGHGVVASVDAGQYAKDLKVLKAILDDLYKNSETKPLLAGPGGFYNDPQWFTQILEDSGPNVLNVLTHHVYNLGGGDDPHVVDRITDPSYLSGIADTFKSVQLLLQKHGPWASAWVGEAGGVYNSGSPQVSNTFLDSFWYLDQLGMASKYGTKIYCRQTLIGGNYGLLDTTFVPNPDYYSALLWHQLMGKGVLAVDIKGPPYLKAYALCSKATSGISLLLINLSKSATINTTVHNDMNVNLSGGRVEKGGAFLRKSKRALSWIGRKASDMSVKRREYHLTGENQKYLSRVMHLNGKPLMITENGNIPELRPVLAEVSKPIITAPMSIAFVVLPNFEAHACVPIQ